VNAAICCGSTEVYNILQSEMAEELWWSKVQNLFST